MYRILPSWSKGWPFKFVSKCQSDSHCQAIDGTRILSIDRSTVPSADEKWYRSVGNKRELKPSRGNHR